jgi:hypothetical protein
MTVSEHEVREMLERRAGDFAMPPHPTRDLRRGARRRRTRAIARVATGALALAAFGLIAAGLAGTADRPAHPVATGAGNPTASKASLKLVSYSLRGIATESDPPHHETGNSITHEDLRKHAECMRSQGFDVPDPTQGPGGWGIIIDHPAAHGIDLSSRAFREAMFVTCGPLGGPLTGDMVIGGSREKIDRLMSCMRQQGYDLPEPTRDTSGAFDIDEWSFDLTSTDIDTSTTEWNRAMFLTCAPDVAS